MKNTSYYVIDSSSLIELNVKYPIDVFLSLWKNIELLINHGVLIAPKEVLKEISVFDDSLKKWAMKQKKLFKDFTENQIKIVTEILRKYPSLAKPDSELPAADPVHYRLGNRT